MSARIITVIVGWNHWYDYTLPALRSILKYEHKPYVVVVDNGSDTPYPIVDGVKTIWAKKRQYYQVGINAALDSIASDWYLVLNNDILCMGPYQNIIQRLDPSVLWCAEIRKTASGINYIVGWLYILSRQVIDKVGLFDENYDGCWDDGDYTYAALDAGVEIKTVNLPFVHLETRTRREIPGYYQKRREAILYFEKKWGVRLNEAL